MLVAAVPYVLPGVAPGHEALRDVGLDAEHEEAGIAAPPTARNTVAKEPERMKAITRKAAKKTSAVPKSPISARAQTHTAENTINTKRFLRAKSLSSVAARCRYRAP